MNEYLIHHGIKGQRWGVRRYQNPDGTLTPKGKARLNDYKKKELLKIDKRYSKEISGYEKAISKYKTKIKQHPDKKNIYKKNALQINKRYLSIAKAEKLMETKAIKTMKIDDMQAERKAAGKAYVKTVLGMTLLPAAMALSPSPVVGFSRYSPTAAKYNMRLQRTKNK